MADVNDIVLIYLEESPVSFARVESILPDAKKDWYHIKLLMLQIPLQVATWILKDDYINGDPFFMNGKQMQLKKVECPPEETDFTKPATIPQKEPDTKTAPARDTDAEYTDTAGSPDESNIISFSDLKNKED